MRDRKNTLKVHGCQVQLKMSADKVLKSNLNHHITRLFQIADISEFLAYLLNFLILTSLSLNYNINLNSVEN